mgnify:CR=1 FL=1
MLTQEQIENEIDNIRDAFATGHTQGWEIGRKHGTASIKPAQNRELSTETRAEKYYGLMDENVKMKTH